MIRLISSRFLFFINSAYWALQLPETGRQWRFRKERRPTPLSGNVPASTLALQASRNRATVREHPSSALSHLQRNDRLWKEHQESKRRPHIVRPTTEGVTSIFFLSEREPGPAAPSLPKTFKQLFHVNGAVEINELEQGKFDQKSREHAPLQVVSVFRTISAILKSVFSENKDARSLPAPPIPCGGRYEDCRIPGAFLKQQGPYIFFETDDEFLKVKSTIEHVLHNTQHSPGFLAAIASITVLVYSCPPIPETDRLLFPLLCPGNTNTPDREGQGVAHAPVRFPAYQ